MSKVSRLEEQGFDSRKQVYGQSDYYKEDGHKYWDNGQDTTDIIAKEGSPLGKDNGIPLGVAGLPGATKSRGINYSTMNTKSAGGLYDIKGGPDTAGHSGREWSQVHQLYNASASYGTDSVEITPNIDGQYYMTPPKRGTLKK